MLFPREPSFCQGEGTGQSGGHHVRPIGVADLGGRILKWAKTDEKL